MSTHNKVLDFQGFLSKNPDIKAAFDKACKSRNFSKDKIIVAHGETDQDMFLLRTGRAKVVIYSKGGNEIHLTGFKAGSLFGEMATLLKAPRTSNVVAQTECIVGIISAKDFNALMQKFSALAIYMTQLLAQRLQETSQSLYESHAFTVPQRVYENLLRQAEQSLSDFETYRLSPSPSVTTLSDNLNVSREAASRAITKLVSQGLIKKEKTYWEIIRPQFAEY